MAQRTELESSPVAPAENPVRQETHSAEPPPSNASEFFRQRPHARMYLIVAALVLLVGGVFAWRYFSSYESTDDAQVDGQLALQHAHRLVKRAFNLYFHKAPSF